MEDLIYDELSPEQTEFLHKVLDKSLSFFDYTDKSTFNYAENFKIISKLKECENTIPINNDSQFFDFLRFFLNYSVPQCKKGYLAFPDCGNSVSSIAAEIIKSCTNQNMVASERSAPVATLMEIQLIQWLRRLLGYSFKKIDDLKGLCDVGALCMPGGTLSNYCAVLTALRIKYPAVLQEGIGCLKKKPIVFTAKEISHYSIENALEQLGLGSHCIAWVDVNTDYQTDIFSLEEKIKTLPDDCEPFMIIGFAGNSKTSSIDDLYNMSVLAEKYNLWFHVDASHGGSLLFSKNQKDRLIGIENAHSVTMDPHKGLFVSYASSYVFFKDSTILETYCKDKTQFYDVNCLNLGKISPFLCSRGFDSLKLWLMISRTGKERIGNLIDLRASSVETLKHKIEKKIPKLILLNSNYIYRLAYVYLPEESHPKNQDYINWFNKKISTLLYHRGNIIVDSFTLKDIGNKVSLGCDKIYTVIGICIGHTEIHEERIISELNECINIIKKETMPKNVVHTTYDSPADWTCY